MKINVQYGRDSGVNPTAFQDALEDWVLEWLDIEEELVIETTLEGESHASQD
jgi:hypothetical protein